MKKVEKSTPTPPKKIQGPVERIQEGASRGASVGTGQIWDNLAIKRNAIIDYNLFDKNQNV